MMKALVFLFLTLLVAVHENRLQSSLKRDCKPRTDCWSLCMEQDVECLDICKKMSQTQGSLCEYKASTTSDCYDTETCLNANNISAFSGSCEIYLLDCLESVSTSTNDQLENNDTINR